MTLYCCNIYMASTSAMFALVGCTKVVEFTSLALPFNLITPQMSAPMYGTIVPCTLFNSDFTDLAVRHCSLLVYIFIYGPIDNKHIQFFY